MEWVVNDNKNTGYILNFNLGLLRVAIDTPQKVKKILFKIRVK